MQGTASTTPTSALDSETADRATRDERIKAHMDLVRAIAGGIRSRPLGRGVDLDDLVGYGAIGLLEAASRFDPTKGVPFAAFAGRRIQGAVVDGIRAQHWFGRGADPNLRIERVGEAWLIALADAARASNDTRWSGRPMVQPPVELDETRQSLVAAELNRLPEPQRRLVDLCYFHGKTLSAAAKELGFGRSWASRLHARALGRLRAAAQKDVPLPYRRSQPRPSEKHPVDSVPTDRRVRERR
jgi:RNA polymerase sigma factor FliA